MTFKSLPLKISKVLSLSKMLWSMITNLKCRQINSDDSLDILKIYGIGQAECIEKNVRLRTGPVAMHTTVLAPPFSSCPESIILILNSPGPSAADVKKVRNEL